jgi:hypothetical protein
MPDAVRHADPLQSFHHPRFAISRWHLLAVGQRQFNVFINRQVADQVETLKNETDLLIPYARPFREIEVLDRLSIQRVASGGRCIEQPDDRQQR